jgi:hypothetical protein
LASLQMGGVEALPRRVSTIPAAIVRWSTRARAEKVDEELFLAVDAVLPTMRPEAAELRIGVKSWQQVIRHCRNRAVSTKSLVEVLLVALISVHL